MAQNIIVMEYLNPMVPWYLIFLKTRLILKLESTMTQYMWSPMNGTFIHNSNATRLNRVLIMSMVMRGLRRPRLSVINTCFDAGYVLINTIHRAIRGQTIQNANFIIIEYCFNNIVVEIINCTFIFINNKMFKCVYLLFFTLTPFLSK